MAMTKRGPVYYADLRDLDGGRQSLFTRNEAVARSLYLRIQKVALKGRKVDPRAMKRIAKTLRNDHLATARLGTSTGDRRRNSAEWRVVFSGANHSPVLDLRKSTELSQKEFWSRIGVPQTAGSRYENEARRVPAPVRMLLAITYGTQRQQQAVLKRLHTRM